MPLRPLEALNLAVTAAIFTLALICCAMGRLDWAAGLPWRCAALLLSVLVIIALRRAYRSTAPRYPRLAGVVGFLTDFYPAALIPLIYDTLGFLIPAINPVEKDHWLIAADRALFGVDPTIWLQRFIWPPLTDVLYVAYATFFFLPLIVGIPLWIHSARLGRRFLFTLSFAFYVSYAGYVLVPAEGPRSALAPEETIRLRTTPLSRAIAGTLNGLERNRVDAFPSGHVLITCICLWTAARHERRIFRFLLPVGLLLILSTVYCRYHYVVDVMAGLILAVLIPPIAGWMYDKLSGERIGVA